MKTISVEHILILFNMFVISDSLFNQINVTTLTLRNRRSLCPIYYMIGNVRTLGMYDKEQTLMNKMEPCF